MIDVLYRLFRRERSSVTAKERLRLVLLSDHLSLSPETVESLKHELIGVISRYMMVDEEHSDVSFEQQDEQMLMLANIAILGIRTEPPAQPAIAYENHPKLASEQHQPQHQAASPQSQLHQAKQQQPAQPPGQPQVKPVDEERAYLYDIHEETIRKDRLKAFASMRKEATDAPSKPASDTVSHKDVAARNANGRATSEPVLEADITESAGPEFVDAELLAVEIVNEESSVMNAADDVMASKRPANRTTNVRKRAVDMPVESSATHAAIDIDLPPGDPVAAASEPKRANKRKSTAGR